MNKLNKNQKIATGLSLLVVGFFFLFGQNLVSFFLTQKNTGQINNYPQIQDIRIGQGKELQKGDQVSLAFVGRFLNGDVFDSSSNSSPIIFTLGAGQVIQGIELGVSGMRVGGKRVVVVPPNLAYGNLEVGPIPPNSTLIFEVEVLDAR